MGTCTSCEAAAASCCTAKMILPDGRLLEYSAPATPADVLRNVPGCFVCSADDMEFESFVAAVGEDEELEPGQIYFVLPLSMLHRRLHADDMAALAVRASSSLTRCGVVAVEGGRRHGAMVAPHGVEMGRKGRGRSGAGRHFDPELCAIPEQE